MTRYELVVLLHPDLEIDLDTPIKKIESHVVEAGGSVAKKDNWGKRKLAYPIKKQEFAIYVYWEIDLPADGLSKLDRALNITDEVLRHLVTKYIEIPEADEKKEEKSDKEKPEQEKE